MEEMQGKGIRALPSILSVIQKNLLRSIRCFLYPPLCLHCRQSLSPSLEIFCASCLNLLTLLDAEGRCSSCFAEGSFEVNGRCKKCRSIRNPFYRLAAAFDYEGPAKTLIQALKYGNKSFLAKGAGSWLTAQFLSLDWPIPDLIVPAPISRMRLWQRGFNQSELLANQIALALEKPVVTLLKRRSLSLRQAGLTSAQRQALKADEFHLNRTYDLRDKNILLVDDVMTTGATLMRCGEVLLEGYPSAIYGLTLCKTLD